jgi:CRP-like cAMP-binding protein
LPKAANYKANSIVYFKGDMSEKIYILKSGAVSLKTNDIETGQEINDTIQTGEFFGVKSALGKYPREETAIVLTNSSMLVFSIPEFEAIVSKNARIILQMLKVFSNQLRRIHRQVRNLLSSGEQVNPEDGLFNIGNYYFSHQRYHQALYALRRYLTYYPSGKFSSQVTDLIRQAEQASQFGASPAAAASFAPVVEQTSFEPPSVGGEMSGSAKQYYNAISLFSQEKYAEALKEFKTIVEIGNDEEYKAKSIFEIGRCLYEIRDYDGTISHYTSMIQKYPKHPELKEALLYVGASYEKKGILNKAKGFYTKIISMTSNDAPVHRKAKRALERLG